MYQVKYPSEYFQALVNTFLAVGNPQFVRHTVPLIAACALDWAIAMELAFIADATDEDVRLFELHLRRHVYALAELFNAGLCWYYFQGLKVLISQFKETRWLVGNSQQCVEHSMQTVRQATRHTVHGAVGAPKKGVDRAEDLAAKRAKAPSEHKALWRNLLFHMMSAVRSFSEKTPDVQRMTFMGAWSLLCEKINEGRTMVWSTLKWQCAWEDLNPESFSTLPQTHIFVVLYRWRFCRAMVKIYGKLRAHHRIHQTGQEDYYRRVREENRRYWEPVKLPNGTWAPKTDSSRKAKEARHRRYVNKKGNAIYKEKYDLLEDMDQDGEREGEGTGEGVRAAAIRALRAANPSREPTDDEIELYMEDPEAMLEVAREEYEVYLYEQRRNHREECDMDFE